MDNLELIDKLRDFMEHEARACSMDPRCITPLYVYRMWGGAVPIQDITVALSQLNGEPPAPPSA